MPDLTGQTLKGRYRVEALLGRGGMAEVYKAWDTWRNYHVAVKVMREDLAEDLEFLRRFRREATALAKLAHENIVRFYAFEQDDLTAFIVMDYVEGTTLRAEIARADGPLPSERVLAITRQVCAALNYAHLEGVIHRDVKPGNIMLRPDGRVLLSDFGISKAMDAATATATTVSVGTPAYMSPEQCAGQAPDGRTDVYSLGVVVYEMLAGRRPFVGDLAPETITNTTERIRWEQMHAAAPALRKLNPAVSREVEAAVMTALAKDREARWPTVAVFGEALEQRMGADKRMGGAAAGEQRGRGAEEQRSRGARETKVVSPPRPIVRPVATSEARPAARSFGLRDVPWPIWAVGGGLVMVLAVTLVAKPGGGRPMPTTGTPSTAIPPAKPTSISPTLSPTAPAVSWTATPQDDQKFFTYVVQRGDTMSGIAVRFMVSMAELMKLNNIADPDGLYPGQQLRIPRSAVATPTPSQSRTYTVRAGDTLFSIATRFGVTIAALEAANNITDPNTIYVGMELKIP
jgi:LysM repeat protein/tRNA A-37 threonylcarbamoyl transferase component Bud32